MVFLLLETFDREGPRGRLVLVFLNKLMDIGTVPVPLLPMGRGGRADRAIGGPFGSSILAIFLSAQGAKSGLLLIVTRTRWQEIVCGELPKGEVKRRTRVKTKSENDRMACPGPASKQLTRLPRLRLEVQFSSHRRTAQLVAGAIEVHPASGWKNQPGPWRHLETLLR